MKIHSSYWQWRIFENAILDCARSKDSIDSWLAIIPDSLNACDKKELPLAFQQIISSLRKEVEALNEKIDALEQTGTEIIIECCRVKSEKTEDNNEKK